MSMLNIITPPDNMDGGSASLNGDIVWKFFVEIERGDEIEWRMAMKAVKWR